MSVTRTPVSTASTELVDPTNPESKFYRDLEQHLRSRRLSEEAKDMADRFKDRTKANTELIGHKDNTGSFVISFEEDDEGYLQIAGEEVKFVKSEKYKKSKGGVNADRAKELLTDEQWTEVTSHVITIELPGHAPVKAVVDAVRETLADADITEGFAIDPRLEIVEDKVVNLNYFDGPDQISDELLADLMDDDEYATRLIVKKVK